MKNDILEYYIAFKVKLLNDHETDLEKKIDYCWIMSSRRLKP